MIAASLHDVLQARIVAPLLCLAAVVVTAITGDTAFEASRQFVFDAYQRIAPAAHAVTQVVVIDIDANSIHRFGQWPWPRDRLARLVDAAAAARVVGIDVLLSEPDRLSPAAWAASRSDLSPEIRTALAALPATDGVLAAALAPAPVVLAAAVESGGDATATAPTIATTPVFESGEDARTFLPRYRSATPPLPEFAAAARGLGIASAVPEPDGVLRRAPAVIAVGTTLRPSFAVEVLRVATEAERLEFRAGPFGLRTLTVGAQSIRTDRAGRVWLRYTGAPPPLSVVSASRILDGSADPALFRDRVVLIGTTAAGLGDVVASPLQEQITGIMAQRQLVENLLAGDTLWRPDLAVAIEALAALALGTAATLLFGRLRDRLHAVLFAGSAMAFVAVSFAAFSVAGLLLDWTMPLVALLAVMLAALAVRMRDEMRARQLREGELATALMQAEAADRAKTEFLANASHELRTPLTAVIGFSEIMANEMMGKLTPIYAEYARNIHQSGAHLLSVIDDVLDLSVIDLGGMQPKDAQIEVAHLVADCERMVAVRAADRAVLVKPELASMLPVLVADQRMVRQMLLNLLSNAIKYSPRQGRVDILVAVAPDGWLAISVRDAGPGIAPGDIHYAMQRFGRLRSAAMAQEPGIGIGLPLTKSMVELHGGRFEIRSKLGAGTEALLWFPPARLAHNNAAPGETKRCDTSP